MRTRFLSPVFCLLLILTVTACGSAEPEGATNGNGGDAEPAAEEHEGEMGGDDHEHAEGADRDAYSKPDELYAFLDIEPGDVVIDLMAGGGYNAVRLAELVGEEGGVIAEGGSEDLVVAVESGEAPSNIEIVSGLEAVADGRADAVVAVRAYHLFPDVPAVLAEMMRVLEPGGVVGIVEVRLNEEYGHDMTSHRMGEQTVIEDMEAAGFEYVESSDLLRRDDDDYTSYRGGERHMTDRMLLKFRKPE